MKKIIIFGSILALSLTLTACKKQANQTSSQNQQNQTSSTQTSQQKKSTHYESSTPEHESILTGVPTNVVINFNFDLAGASSISITQKQKEYGVGRTTIDSNKLSMRRPMDQSAPDGTYIVNYIACWPDGSCHDGNFQFSIDKSQASTFVDMTGQSEVTIDMKDIAFVPQNVKISKGTKVTWTNNDSETHYVNTDSHPGHTYEPNMNSKALAKGDTYSYTFENAGIYPYHCSAHTQMTADILVL